MKSGVQPIIKVGKKTVMAYTAVSGEDVENQVKQINPRQRNWKTIYNQAILLICMFILGLLLYQTLTGVSKTNIEKEEIMEKLIVELLQADTDRIHNSSNFERNRRNLDGQMRSSNTEDLARIGEFILNPDAVCDGDMEKCKDMETFFENKTEQIAKVLVSDKYFVKIEEEEKKYVALCEQDYHTQSQSIERKGGGGESWLTVLHREEFYQECLKNFDVRRLHRKGTRAVKKMNQFATEISDTLNEKGKGQIGGGTVQVIGGVLGGVGIVLAPFTGGASLTLNLAGAGIGTTGSVTTFISSYLTQKWTEELVSKTAQITEEAKLQQDNLNTLLGLFIDAQTKRENSWNDIKVMKDTFSELLRDTTSSGIIASFNFADFATRGRSAYTLYMNKYPASIASKLKPNFKPITNRFIGSKGINFFSTYTMNKNHISKSVQTKISKFGSGFKTGANVALAGINVGFGIWDIMKGKRNLDGEGDLSDVFRAAAKSYSYDLDSTLTAYKEVVGEPAGGLEDSYQEVTRISVKSVNGQFWNAGTKLKLFSEDSSQPGQSVPCLTKVLDQKSYQPLASGHWYLVDGEELGDCNFYKVFEKAEIRLINDHDNEVAFSHITISTETRLVPALACTSDGTLNTMDSSTISSFKGKGLSKPLTCFPMQGISMIKTHTKDERFCGTDASVRMFVTQYNFKDGKPEGIETAWCNTKWLDNADDEMERDKVDSYHIDQLGSCTKPFHENFNPEYGYLGTKLEHQTSLWEGGAGCLDTLKVYAKTSVNTVKGFRCNIWGDEGKGLTFGENSFFRSKFTKTDEKICKLEKPSPRGIEKIKLHVTDNFWADSNGPIQLMICNDQDKNVGIDEKDNCCTTNVKTATFTRNKFFTLDGDDYDELEGEELGQCEHFIVKGSKVAITVHKHDFNEVSFDEISLYGASDMLLTTADIPFISCSGKQIWAESGKVKWHTHSTRWYRWDEPAATWLCSYTDYTSIKSVHVRLCPEKTAGTASKIETEFINIAEKSCNTNALFNIQTLGGNDYHTFTDMGSCASLKVIDSRVYMNLKNVDERDNLCLTHVWVDVSDSRGSVKQLECKFHAKQRDLNVNTKTGAPFPMLCQ